MSTESSPFGRLVEAFTSEAFAVHPYRFGTIGLPVELQSLTRTAGEAFFHRYYVASNMTIAIVGDVTLDELRPLAERYFSDIPSGPKPPAVTAVEPEQTAARRTVLTDAAQPAVMMGWHIPAASDPRYVAYTALADLLGGSDYARLQRALVRDKGLSVSEETTIGFPGERFPCLWGLISIPASGVAPDSLEREVARVLDDVQGSHPLTQDELDGYKVRVRAQKLAAVEGNAGLADQLSMAQALRGGWREFFRAQERVDALTLADLAGALRTTFRRTNCTTAMIVNPPPDSTTVGH